MFSKINKTKTKGKSELENITKTQYYWSDHFVTINEKEEELGELKSCDLRCDEVINRKHYIGNSLAVTNKHSIYLVG